MTVDSSGQNLYHDEDETGDIGYQEKVQFVNCLWYAPVPDFGHENREEAEQLTEPRVICTRKVTNPHGGVRAFHQKSLCLT